MTGTTEDSVTVAWNASTDNSGRILRYVVHYWGGGLYVSGTSTTKTITGLVPSFSTQIRVEAVDYSENRSAPSAPITATTAPDTTAPTTPTSLRVTGTGLSSVSLAWNASSDRWALSYEVLMDGQVVGGSAETSSTRRNLAPGSTHTFTVRARDSSGNVSQASNAVTVTLPASDDTTPPSAPTNLVATTPPNDFCGSNVLTWSGSTDNSDPASAIEYEVYLNGRLYHVTPPGVPRAFLYTNSGTNTWTVVAVDRSGNSSAPSNPSTVTVVSDPDFC